MYFLDTNIIARFLIGDVPKLQDKVKKIFREGDEKQLEYVIIPEVLIELNYVLSSHYQLSKLDITEALQGILDLSFIQIKEYEADFSKVLNFYKHYNLSLEDCLYLQLSLENGLKLLTFDQKLEKIYKELKNKILD